MTSTTDIGEHAAARAWSEEAPERARRNLTQLSAFWERRDEWAARGLMITRADLARDRALLEIMCGDFTRPRVVGAANFAQHLASWARFDDVRRELFSQDRMHDFNLLRRTFYDLIKRSAYEQRAARVTIVDPILDGLGRLKTAMKAGEDRTQLMSAWSDFVKLWNEDGFVAAMQRNVGEGRDKCGSLQTARAFERMQEQFVAMYGRVSDDPDLRQLRRLKKSHDDHAGEMRGCLRRLQGSVCDSISYPTADAIATGAQHIESEVTAWYRSYVQLMRQFYRQRLGMAMRTFDREQLVPMHEKLDGGLVREVVEDAHFVDELIARRDAIAAMSTRWFDEFERLRFKHRPYEQIVGSISRLSHAMRAWVQKPQTILDRMRKGLKDPAELVDEIRRIPADDEETRAELLSCLEEDFLEVVPYLKGRAARWTELRRGFENRMGDDPAPYEIRSIFLSTLLHVQERSPAPPWIDNEALLDISINLCLNAINHLPAGHEYGAAIFFGQEGFAVIDNGPGIMLDRFAELQQKAPVTSTKGTGLGFFLIGNVLLGELTADAPDAAQQASMRVYTAPNIGTAVSVAYRGNHNFVRGYLGSQWKAPFKAMTHSFTLS